MGARHGWRHGAWPATRGERCDAMAKRVDGKQTARRRASKEVCSCRWLGRNLGGPRHTKLCRMAYTPVKFLRLAAATHDASRRCPMGHRSVLTGRFDRGFELLSPPESSGDVCRDILRPDRLPINNPSLHDRFMVCMVWGGAPWMVSRACCHSGEKCDEEVRRDGEVCGRRTVRV